VTSRGRIAARRRHFAWAIVLIVIAASPTRLHADDTPAPGALPAEITGSGTVIDAETGQPVSGAKVTIWESGPTLEDGLPRHHECLSHGDGKFEFTVPTDHASTLSDGGRFVPFTIVVKHPNYVFPPTQASLQVATGVDPLLRRLQAAAPQAVARAAVPPIRELRPVRVVPAKPVTGVLQSPDGKPAHGVRIYAYSSAPALPPLDPRPQGFGAQLAPMRPAEAPQQFQDETTTDVDGHFRLVVPGVGETILYIAPDKEYAQSREHIADKRGDVGVITLEKGATISGRLLDPDNKPLSGVFVHAVLQSPFWPRDTSVRLQVSISRTAKTDADGAFLLAPLPTGEYLIQPRGAAGDFVSEKPDGAPAENHPRPSFLAPQLIALSDDHNPKLIEVHARPTALVSGHTKIPPSLLDAIREENRIVSAARGQLTNQPEETEALAQSRLLQRFAPRMRFKINGTDWGADGQIDEQGNFTIAVPGGLADGIIVVPTTVWPADSSRRTQAKWRTDKDRPLVTGEEIPIGRVDADIQGIEIVYPDPPQPPAPAQPQRPARGAGS